MNQRYYVRIITFIKVPRAEQGDILVMHIHIQHYVVCVLSSLTRKKPIAVMSGGVAVVRQEQAEALGVACVCAIISPRAGTFREGNGHQKVILQNEIDVRGYSIVGRLL